MEGDFTDTFAANPAEGWTFYGWNGACGGSTEPCEISVPKALSEQYDIDFSIEAKFVPRQQEHTLVALLSYSDSTDADRVLTLDTVRDLVEEGDDSLAYYLNEASRGVYSSSFTYQDWLSMELTLEESNVQGATAYTIVQAAADSLSSYHDLNGYDRLLLFVTPADLGNPGCVAFPEPISLQLGSEAAEIRVAILSGYDMGCAFQGRIRHEYVHTLGIPGHSYTFDCQNDIPFPKSLVDLGELNDSCTGAYLAEDGLQPPYTEADLVELESSGLIYGGIDVLGNDYNGSPHDYLQSYWQYKAGWLTEENVLVAEESTEITLLPLEANANGTKLVRIPLGSDHEGNELEYLVDFSDSREGKVDMRLLSSCLYSSRQEQISCQDLSPVRLTWTGLTFIDGVLTETDDRFEERGSFATQTSPCMIPTGASPVDFPRGSNARVVIERSALKIASGPVASGNATIELKNDGDSMISIGSATLGGRHPEAFEIASDSCSGIDLAPGAICSINVETAADILYEYKDKLAVLKLTSSDPIMPEPAVTLVSDVTFIVPI